MICSWRLAATANYQWVTYLYTLNMVLILSQFIQTVWIDIHANDKKNQLHLSVLNGNWYLFAFTWVMI